MQRCTLFTSCDFSERPDLFFSTTWCRDRLFTSDDPNDVLRFYDTFNDREGLIEWMRERPRGRTEIIEVEGDRNIVVVIPTADFNGQYAKECRENIFNGLQTIFVESGSPKDPYFNYAHSINKGIEKAITYGPRWIIISNDDMIKIDDISLLKSQLDQLNEKEVDVVFTRPGSYHSTPSFIGEPNFMFVPILKFFSKFVLRIAYIKKSHEILKRFNKRYYYPCVNYPTLSSKHLFNTIVFTKIKTFTNVLSFGIFSRFYIESNESLYDENYVNEMEDTDLSVRLAINGNRISYVDYKIGERIGLSIGTGEIRDLRTVVGSSYFASKFENWTE